VLSTSLGQAQDLGHKLFLISSVYSLVDGQYLPYI